MAAKEKALLECSCFFDSLKGEVRAGGGRGGRGEGEAGETVVFDCLSKAV